MKISYKIRNQQGWRWENTASNNWWSAVI